MIKLFSRAVLLTLMFAVPFAPVWAADYDETIRTFKDAGESGEFFGKSYGYAVFPTIGKGGIGIGGSYGKGRVYAGGRHVGNTSVTQVTIGFQLGGQAYSMIVFFQDRRAFDEFTSGNFEFDAGVSAVAITAGVQAKAGTEGATAGASAGPATGAQAETSYYKGMVVFVQAKGGLMYEATVGGQKFSFEPKK